MRKDYHMHPMAWTEDKLPLFVEKALQMGISEICITDHMPLLMADAEDRMRPGTVRDYCRRVGAWADRYGDVISIKCGIEIDYHPSLEGYIEDILACGPFDHILGSTHMQVFLQDERCTHNDFAAAALENTLRAVESGYFTAISHLDQFRCVFAAPQQFPMIPDGYDPMRHERVIREILGKLREKDVALEINPHFAEALGDVESTYPQARIVEWALDAGVRFVYGSDAHAPDSVGALLDELENHPVYGRAIKQWENA